MSRLFSIFRLSALALLSAAWAFADVGQVADLARPSHPPSPGFGVTSRGGLPLSREELLSTLTRDLAAHFNLEGELQLELVRAWTPPARLATAWQISVLDYPAASASSMLVRCRLADEAAYATEITLVLKASLWRDAWITRQPLAVGATFDPTALEVRRVDLLRERDALPTSAGDRSYVFARAVSAGRLLTWRDVARRPLVRKGSVVEVSVADGLLVVTMKALAMENGGQGEAITVRNPESRKDFVATVVDENRVQVRL